MSKKRYTTEQVIMKLREIEVMTGRGDKHIVLSKGLNDEGHELAVIGYLDLGMVHDFDFVVVGNSQDSEVNPAIGNNAGINF